MSAIFGTCLSRNAVVDERSMLRLAEATSRYGVDETHIFSQRQIGMGFQSFQTHHRARLEQQPLVDHLGNILVLDGRLDNYLELAAREGINGEAVSDSALILKAFERWGHACFSKLVGDWALALWSRKDHVLYLARDHAGSRTLYYSSVHGETRWSTNLETLLMNGISPELDREYIARTLSCQAIRDLTPYKDIRTVPPAHYLAIRDGQGTLRSHWRWIADTAITYRSDTEYDEHFLQLFRSAVQRRFEPGGPILAELSGGMDSSSIVCMADKIVCDSSDPSNLINTVSYYDDTEPDWDERPYFISVEKHRNKSGAHLDCSSRTPSFEPLILPDRIYPYPGADSASIEYAAKFEERVGAGRYRAILSGIGGDELLGGVPTPMPELANYLRQGKIIRLLSGSVAWCMVERKPLLHMLYDTLTFTSSLYRAPHADPDTIPPWLSPEARRLCLRSQSYSQNPVKFLTVNPSALDAGQTWWSLLETLPHLTPHLLGRYEYRYPYLDRDLVEFLHRIPREQLVRPGRRRLLMRRALNGIVPTEILERKRKAFISHGPIIDLRNGQQKILNIFSNPLISDCGLIDRDKFLHAFHRGLTGDVKWVGHLSKTIGMELWLKSLQFGRGAARGDTSSRVFFRKVLSVSDRTQKLRASNART
jgi:asparagine synthase (glutamine-hydrolysing)